MTDINECAEPPETPQEESAPTPQSKNPVKLRISVYFDGTGNNRANIQAREGNTATYQLVKRQEPLKSKDGRQVIGTSAASFEADFSNISIMEENFKDNSRSDLEFHTAIYVEGAGTRDLEKATEVYEKQMQSYQSIEDMNIFYRALLFPGMSIPPKPKFKIDSDMGFSTATFATGIYQKINAGFDKVLDWYENLVEEEVIKSDEHEVTEILVDVFGFSRGAATARTFIHHILQGQKLIIGTKLTRRGTRPVYSQIPCPLLHKTMLVNGVTIKEDALKVDFVGLFDTVSSYKSALSSDVKSLKLDAITKARKVYHLAAAEEHRLCFSLTDISSAKNAGTGEEYFLPGVHSDIGGGYRGAGEEVETEDFDIFDHDSWAMLGLNTSSINVNLSEYAAMLEREGWFNNGAVQSRPQPNNWQIRVNRKYIYMGPSMSMSMGSDTMEVEYSISVYRDQVKNTYRRIPLNLMAEAATSNGLVFEDDLTNAHKVPGELQSVDAAIRSYIGRIGNNSTANDWFTKSSTDIGNQFNIESLRNQHLHYSAKMSLGLWPRIRNSVRFRQRYPG